METIYITPAGTTCTCGHISFATSGGQAVRMAYIHNEDAHGDKATIVDYRQMSDQLKQNDVDMKEASELIVRLRVKNEEQRRAINHVREQVEREITRIKLSILTQ